ncbi:hypothetical protein C6503_02900 [Candidatus Poribacteria bacterium]|nr:MAG: hypothetical protein C6503_02900 [Candidatus Poribacteria bacterium]
MDAYIIMLHLRSQGWERFYGEMARHRVGHINTMIMYLSEEWGEDIPRINAFVFTGVTECTSYICKHVFRKDDGEQPDPKGIAEHAAKIAAYPKWDKIVEILRREAFEVAE